MAKKNQSIDEDDSNDDGDTDNNGKPGSDGASTPKKKGTDWELAYKALQATHGKKVEELREMTEQRDAFAVQLEETKSTLADKAKDQGTLASDVTTKDAEIETLKAAADTSTKALERAKYIMEHYPELSIFESQGILPAADTTEALDEKLKSFKTTLEKLVGKKVEFDLQGVTPIVKTNEENQETTEDEDEGDLLWQEMVIHAKDPVKYKKARDAWDKSEAAKMAKIK